MDEFVFCMLGAWVGFLIGLIVGCSCAEPTELPNDCILHNDVIYCEVTE